MNLETLVMLSSVPVCGVQKDLPFDTVTEFADFLGNDFAGNILSVSSIESAGVNGSFRMRIDGIAASDGTLAMTSIAGNHIVSNVLRMSSPRVFHRNGNIPKLSVFNPHASASFGWCATLLREFRTMSKASKLIALGGVEVTVANGAEAEIDWSSDPATAEFGDIVVLQTTDSSGTNYIRVAHNRTSSIPTDVTVLAGVGTYAVFNTSSIHVAHEENIRATRILNESGGNLSFTVTKFRVA